jgi:hypothetical protein
MPRRPSAQKVPPHLEGERSFNATTAYLETMAKAMTPFTFFPMPRSSNLRSLLKKSVLEKRRLEERASEPSKLEVSKATQWMRSEWASCLKCLLLWAN